MNAKLRAAVSHGLMAYLLSLGMTLTLLDVTGLLHHGWMAAMVLFLLTGLVSMASLNRRILLGAGCAALFVSVLWLLIGGAGIIGEVGRALIVYQLAGIPAALPLVGAPFTVICCILCMAASWFVTQRSAGAYPALILLVMIAVLLWLGNMADALVCLLPAAIACVTLLLRAGDEQTSTLRVLPLAAVVTLIAFAGVAVGGAVSQPLKKLADGLRQRIYDTFSYTQPRDVFTLATEGWYPQGQSQLGGPAQPHDQPVMVVTTPRKTYLRGVIKNVYTGRVWLDDIGGRRYLWSSNRFDELRTTAFNQDLPALDGRADSSLMTARTLQVRMLRDSASTMFAPQRVRQLQPEGALTPYFNRSSEIFATSNLVLGDVWNLEAALFSSADANLAALVNAAGGFDDPNWEQVCDDYLQLHEQIDQRVYDMAAEVTAYADTPYASALALQHYLASACSYKLEVAQQPANQDFVSTFLVETKEGYCTYFASAMTVMCRMAGLPARYVEGYVAYPDEKGMAVVTGKEGHAWTEVYFRGFGWVTFDATPISAEYTELPPEDATGNNDPSEPESSPEPTETPTPAPQLENTPAPVPQDAPSDQPTPTPAPDSAMEEGEEPDALDASSGFPWGLLLVLFFALLLRVILVLPDVQAKRQQTEFRRWLVYTQATHDALRQMGWIRRPDETPMAFLLRAEASGKCPVPLASLAKSESVMFYGHAVPFPEETAEVRGISRRLFRSLDLRRKAALLLRRAFLPARVRGELEL